MDCCGCIFLSGCNGDNYVVNVREMKRELLICLWYYGDVRAVHEHLDCSEKVHAEISKKMEVQKNLVGQNLED
jgi:hypothetical protein